MNLLERVFEILIRPAEAWPDFKHEHRTVKSLYVPYAVLLAAIPAVAHIIGASLVGIAILGVRYRASFLGAVGYSMTSYVLSLVDTYLFALAINALAPKFDSAKNLMNALKLSVYSATPYWIAGALFAFPLLSPLALILAIYRFYLLFTGLPVLMNTERERRPLYFILLVSINLGISAVATLVASLLFPEGRLGLM